MPSDSSNRYNLAALSKKNIPSAATLAKEKETRFWEELEVFFKALKHAMSVAFQLDAVRHLRLPRLVTFIRVFFGYAGAEGAVQKTKESFEFVTRLLAEYQELGL